MVFPFKTWKSFSNYTYGCKELFFNYALWFFSPESALKEPSQRTFKQENKGTSTFLLLKLRIFGIYVYSILIGKHLWIWLTHFSLRTGNTTQFFNFAIRKPKIIYLSVNKITAGKLLCILFLLYFFFERWKQMWMVL